MSTVSGNTRVLGQGNLLCGTCGCKYQEQRIVYNNDGQPADFNSRLEVLNTDYKVVACPQCTTPWTLQYKQLGNMGYRVSRNKDCTIKCHCQASFVRAVVLDCDGHPELPIRGISSSIICPICDCKWQVHDATKWFIGYVTLEGEEFPVIVAKERSLRTFIMMHAHTAFDLAESSITGFRAEETTKAEADRLIAANQKRLASFFG